MWNTFAWRQYRATLTWGVRDKGKDSPKWQKLKMNDEHLRKKAARTKANAMKKHEVKMKHLRRKYKEDVSKSRKPDYIQQEEI